MAVLKYKDENGNYQEIVGLNVQNEVVQTTGNSTTAVMSQKAVSDLIPAQASSSNQLADKEFVNSSITTATATYQGSYNLVSDLGLTISASHGQIETALNTAATGADKNDYCFVQIPTADATPTEIASVERYKYNGTTWSYEYAINNSGFTAAQWAAVNSGITSGLVGKLSGMVNTPYTSALGLTKLFGMNDNGDSLNIGLSDLASLLGVGVTDRFLTQDPIYEPNGYYGTGVGLRFNCPTDYGSVLVMEGADLTKTLIFWDNDSARVWTKTHGYSDSWSWTDWREISGILDGPDVPTDINNITVTTLTHMSDVNRVSGDHWPASGGGFCLTICANPLFRIQFVVAYDGTSVYMRTMWGGSWLNWRQIL